MRTLPILLLLLLTQAAFAQPAPKDNLQFDHLAKRWDEAMPLGNGMLGALIWGKNDQLRLSLDRADLWDERKAMDLSGFNFKWVRERLLANDYDTVHRLGDDPYDNLDYPTKLPVAAIEFNIAALGEINANTLDIRKALNTIRFKNGTVFNCYIHATKQAGYFGFENLPASAMNLLQPQLIIPDYAGEDSIKDDNTHSGGGVRKLGYKKGTITRKAHTILYHQPTYNGHYYEVAIEWYEISPDHIIGKWTITSDRPATGHPLDTKAKEPTGWAEHSKWWDNYWSRSTLSIPDTMLQRQYWLEMYKLGAAARKGAPAITLQAVWTADNGNLPPWKGDFHNDLNTQLSYWPAYTGNHLQEALTYTDWLWQTKENNRKYTEQYFKVPGLSVPGVETLSGQPMGGWIQYSLSPTVAAWCAQHFYWQWKYSMDSSFLKTRAYPYIKATATALEHITYLENGIRKIPLSASPEYHENSVNAYFHDWSNYDLSLAKFLFGAASELAKATGNPTETAHWQQIGAQLPDYDVNETGLTIAPGQNPEESHRHMSPYMAIYPLGLLDINDPKDQPIIDRSLAQIRKTGTRMWCGYSFSWMACLYARAHQADSAARQLQIFASNFCSVNSFHLNGDQKGGEYSDFTYRPFTLEGNFAFAQGIQELLLQSKNGYIELFPAIPAGWDQVSFKDLRAEGAFLISAQKKGANINLTIHSQSGGLCKIKLPNGKILEKKMKKNETIGWMKL